MFFTFNKSMLKSPKSINSSFALVMLVKNSAIFLLNSLWFCPPDGFIYNFQY